MRLITVTGTSRKNYGGSEHSRILKLAALQAKVMQILI